MNFYFFWLVVCLTLSTFVFSSCSSGDANEKFERKIASAQKFVKENKLQEARIELQTAIDLKPADAEGYYQLAEVMIRLGDFSRALENYNSAINYNPNHTDARIHLASLQLVAKQYEMAESNLESALAIEPTNNNALVIKANLTANGPRKNIEEARKILKSVIERTPDFVPALGSLGHLELSAGNPSMAEEYFISATKIEPGNQAIQMALADLYARQGRLDEAQEALGQLVSDNPEQTGFKYVLGEFFLRRGLNDNALEQFEEILSQDPLKHEARDRLYDMYLSRQDTDKAKKLTQDLENKEPNNPLLNYFKGRDAELEGNLNQALEYYLKGISAVGTFAPTFRRAGILELAVGKTREGMEHLTQAIAIDPNDVGARLTLGKTALLQGDIAGSKSHIETILRMYPKQLGANVVRADIALLENELSTAEKVYNFLVENYPNTPIGYYKLGLLEERRENYSKALNHYDKTLSFDQGALSPGRRMVLTMHKLGKSSTEMITKLTSLKDASKNHKADYEVLIGSVLIADVSVPNRLQRAREHFQKALELNPNLIGAYFALGGIDALSGDLDAATESYEKLLKQNPNHIPTRMLLALTLEQQSKYQEATEHYRKILEINPRFGPAANNLAYLLTEEIKGSDLNEALRLAEIAKEELPRESSVADTLAWVHYKKGNPRAALPLLNEAIRASKENEPSAPINPEILYHLAIVQKELGDKEDAKSSIALAIERAGESHPKIAEMRKFAGSIK
ncbi:MAG TPA: tetratricopeptide repeat protein [Oligoflexia bacterium]|nr:tetratricopeptide repeat protein [Oligoflexia bacterium]HMP47486.1 tetratricopeptide repeat protein [Oligoflexia bacterium]